jgi:hypothetical protein
MKRTVIAVGLMLLLFAVAAQAQTPAPKPRPELKEWDLWVGDWTLVGTAKDTREEPEYKLDWRMQGRWILNGFSVEILHTWKGKGAESHSLEILSYDPIKKVHTCYGFSDDGTTWFMTATFKDGVSVENGIDTSRDGKTIRWRNTWNVSPDRMSVSGKSEKEQDGIWWTAFTVKGTKAKSAPKK